MTGNELRYTMVFYRLTKIKGLEPCDISDALEYGDDPIPAWIEWRVLAAGIVPITRDTAEACLRVALRSLANAKAEIEEWEEVL